MDGLMLFLIGVVFCFVMMQIVHLQNRFSEECSDARGRVWELENEVGRLKARLKHIDPLGEPIGDDDETERPERWPVAHRPLIGKAACRSLTP